MSLIPDRWDFELWRNATFRTTISVYMDEAGLVPRDLSGYRGSLTLYDAKTKSPFITLTDTNGGLVFHGSGAIDVLVTAAQTDSITLPQARHQLLITSPGNDTDALLFGLVDIEGI